MPNITSRQIQILKAIIEEFMETADPVGSETLEKKYGLGISPATIRNEMVKLTENGYLKQPHTSAGRIPSSIALKYYVHELMKPKTLSVADEIAVKEKVWDYRFETDKLLKESTKVLSQKTKMLALSTTEKGDIYFSGAAHMLDTPEFYDIEVTRYVLSIMDEFDFWKNLLDKSLEMEEINILLGEELGAEYLSSCGVVYVKFNSGTKNGGTIGVIGPSRINYPVIIPTVKYFGNLISELTRF